MKLRLSNTLYLRAALCLGSLFLYTHPTNAFARDRFREGFWATSGGRSGTFQRNVYRQPGLGAHSTTWQNSGGGQGYHTGVNTWSRQTGTCTHNSSTTYANGKTSSSQGTLTKTGPGSYSYSGTHTGVNGNTTSINKTATRTGNGTGTIDTTYTGPHGKTATKDKTITRNGNGTASVNTTYTGPNGKSAVKDKTVMRTPNGHASVSTTVGPNGKTRSTGRVVTYNNNGNGTETRTATTDVINASGQTKVYSNTGTYGRY